ncbi:aconitate hydratase [Sediminicurvatus halobius]|uniref:Aconitate hydratase n=1 Tax=Sediminicurvatus halobius TaxID=2182432 RepID=A0A2U2N9Q1_9GAMM|nr:aconitate hydratase [Spiribacter halobius]PWG65822.1 aconitate hydratase [Spiribacter halobius]UEX77865.1 aconitate hydratase [Spiribacter halobius]
MTTPATLAEKLISRHLESGADMTPGEEIHLAVDQVLLQDATGTLTMLALEAMGLDRIRVDTACQYVDHNLLQADYRNRDDHVFLQTAAARFGMHFATPGTGVSHPVHMERLGVPGAVLAGSDSHTCAAGSLGMLGFGAGSVEIASVLAGEPLSIRMPEIMGIRLTGRLPAWVSAKDVILELLRRHSVKGGVGRILEYYGPGVETLTAMDRHVIANMGAELGATTSIFPSDEQTRRFLEDHGRGDAWVPLSADAEARYTHHDEIDLGALEPLIATPSSPDNVVPVREVAGTPVHQSYIGSSANPGYRDLAIAALMVRDRQVHPQVSFDLNPASRQVLTDLANEGLLTELLKCGGRLHQTGCNGCMGMGQVPATDQNSLRTTPRNFPGRSGIADDHVYLCSPETATAAALTGEITDPRALAERLGLEWPGAELRPREPAAEASALLPVLPPQQARRVEIRKGPNIADLPAIEPLTDTLSPETLLRLGDNVSTDTISPAGAEAMPYRSNVQAISQFCFRDVDPEYPNRGWATRDGAGHALVAGYNYGQGSSREHAVLAPRYLGLRLVLARSFARIHQQNLVNAGVLALTFADPADYERLEAGDVLTVHDVHGQVDAGAEVMVEVPAKGLSIAARHGMSARQREIFHAGGLINWLQARVATA